MIKIISGTYGTERLTSKSAPFALSKEEEARLVKLGVAEYVDVPEQGENPGTDENAEQGENPGTDNQDAGEDKAPAEPVKPAKQTKGGKGKKAANK